MFASLRPVDLPSQIVHGDLSWENVLFHPDHPPAIIDFSPYWRPATLGLAIAANDALAWEGADPSILGMIDHLPNFYQLLARAAITRVVVAERFFRGGRREMLTDLTAHLPVIEICLARAAG